MVERDLAKVEAAGSSPVSRSQKSFPHCGRLFLPELLHQKSGGMFMRRKLSAFLLIGICMLTACGNKYLGTRLEFTLEASEPSNEYKENTIYITDDTRNVTLHASLDMDCGSIAIQVIHAEDGAVVWENSYEQSGDFDIVLEHLTADQEYLVCIQTTDTIKVHMVLTSPDNLVMDKETPDKPEKWGNAS